MLARPFMSDIWMSSSPGGGGGATNSLSSSLSSSTGHVGLTHDVTPVWKFQK